jgi:hypothetical protein
MRQLDPGGIGIRIQKCHRRHDEAWHAERALEALLVDDTLLNWVQGSVGAREPFDCENFLVADGVCQNGARIVWDAVNQYGTRAAFGSIASELRSSQPQFVAERPRQRFLSHDVCPSRLAVDIDGQESFACPAARLA